jgi:hypothetical protein
MKSWRDRKGITHILDHDALPDSTWCDLIATKRFAGQVYPPNIDDGPPTCVVCIANSHRYYSLANIRSLRDRVQ